MNGSPVNMVDVGYGVSQILPILVDCLRGKPGRMFLLQQPEVHLNPRVQSELASFLAALAKKEQKQFLIETHSDYLIDRLRLDIRDRKHDLKPEDVSILFFERGPKGVTIHPMGIDKWGNIEGAPKGYRKFILEEERRILGL
jgi:predicted ATPase